MGILDYILIFGFGIVLGIAIHKLLSLGVRFPRRSKSLNETIPQVDLLAHEIRTPLTLIKGATEVLLEHELVKPEGKKFLETAIDNCGRVQELTDSFLTMARLKQGFVKLNYSTFDLRELIRETAQEMRQIKNLPLCLSDPGEPINIYADRDLLRQVIWNLLNNAKRHGGGEALEIASRVNHEGVCIEVIDRGIGITPKQRTDMFKPYRQGNSEIPQGLGIGLAIVEWIVKLHRGRILVDSIAGQGTAILVIIPAES